MMGGMAVWLGFLVLCGLAMAQGPEKRRTGNICSVDMDCPDNAFCRLNSYCVCKDGYVYAAVNGTHKGCLKEATIGEECVQHIQCHSRLGVHSECADGACACKSTAHVEGERCYETAVIGDRCVVDENCYLGDRSLPDYQTYCVRGYCTCQLLYSPRDNGTRCVRDATLGEACEDQLQCAGAGLECRGTCRCRDGWVAHNFSKACLESVKKLNEPCDYDVQCDALGGTADAPSPGAALCLGGTCTCGYNARAAGDPLRCWHRRRPGHECKRDEVSGVRVGARQRQGWTPAALLAPPPPRSRVQAGRGEWSCGLERDNASAGELLRCWHRRRPGHECKRDEECVSEEDEPGYCLAGRCTCKGCSPDARDFGGASALPRPPLVAALLLSAAAMLRH